MDLTRNGPLDPVPVEALQAEAIAWFHRNDQDVGSFLFICALLDVDPDFTRQKILSQGFERVASHVRRSSFPPGVNGTGRSPARRRGRDT